MSIGDETNSQSRRCLEARRDADLDALQDGPVGRIVSRSMSRCRDRYQGSGRHHGATKRPTRELRMTAVGGLHRLCGRG
jgi:hypothetical protein